jgi:hypothetical protein
MAYSAGEEQLAYGRDEEGESKSGWQIPDGV